MFGCLGAQCIDSQQQTSLRPFKLERYFARFEFLPDIRLLCCSDPESLSMSELLELADPESKKMWSELSLGYTESAGHPLLRKEIAAQYANITDDDTIVLAPEEGIYLSMRALLEAGDHVVATAPGYQSLTEIARSIGCGVSLWTPAEDPSTFELAFDVSTLIKLIQPNTKLVVVNFPHNPTGCLLNQEEWKALVQACQENNCYLFSDEMYRRLEFDSANTLPAACDVYDKAISLSGLSKVYGLPGLRIGWLACRDAALMGRVTELKDYTTICSSAPSEVLGIMALRNADRLITRTLAICSSNLQAVRKFIDKHEDVFVATDPLAGTMICPRIRDDEVSATRYCEALVKEKGIMLLPASVFDFGDSRFRLGFGKESCKEILGSWHAGITPASFSAFKR